MKCGDTHVLAQTMIWWSSCDGSSLEGSSLTIKLTKLSLGSGLPMSPHFISDALPSTVSHFTSVSWQINSMCQVFNTKLSAFGLTKRLFPNQVLVNFANLEQTYAAITTQIMFLIFSNFILL